MVHVINNPKLPGWQIRTEISFQSQLMLISWRSFTHEIRVRGWVAIVLSSHILCCTPTHWYIPLLAHWVSHDSLWLIRSLSLAYLFSPGLGFSSCALRIYFLDRWVLWVHYVIVRLFHFWVIHDFFFPTLWFFTLSIFKFCLYPFDSFCFYLPLCDDDMLSSRSCRLSLSHPSFHP